MDTSGRRVTSLSTAEATSVLRHRLLWSPVHHACAAHERACHVTPCRVFAVHCGRWRQLAALITTTTKHSVYVECEDLAPCSRQACVPGCFDVTIEPVPSRTPQKSRIVQTNATKVVNNPGRNYDGQAWGGEGLPQPAPIYILYFSILITMLNLFI